MVKVNTITRDYNLTSSSCSYSGVCEHSLQLNMNVSESVFLTITHLNQTWNDTNFTKNTPVQVEVGGKNVVFSMIDGKFTFVGQE